MREKRNAVEIAAAILTVALNGAKKSHIVYKANLNFQLAKTYLTRLIGSGLLDAPNNGSTLFTTTPKGEEYLKYVAGFTQFLTVPVDGRGATS